MKRVGIPAERRHETQSGPLREPANHATFFCDALASFGGVIPFVAFANQPQNVRVLRIGFALSEDLEGGFAAFKETLRELG